MDVYVGMDVAVAKGKKLPICVCRWQGRQLVPLVPPWDLAHSVPRGFGNALTIDRHVCERFAGEVHEYLSGMEQRANWKIRRIGMDASRSPRLDGEPIRACEQSLKEKGISFYKTPSYTEFEAIREKAKRHLEYELPIQKLPSVSMLWMLAGFELFRVLGQKWECIEVFPQATIRMMARAYLSKRSKEGPGHQLAEIQRWTGWRGGDAEGALAELRRVVQAPAHDAVDAYSCAWVAALEEGQRICLGRAPGDGLWVPNAERLQCAKS